MTDLPLFISTTEEENFKLKQQLAEANQRIAELEQAQEPGIFWLADDRDIGFDSLHELADYHLDSIDCEAKPIRAEIQRAILLTNAEYEFKYDSEAYEWVFRLVPQQTEGSK